MNTKTVISLLLLSSPLAVANIFGVTGVRSYGSLDANSIYHITSVGAATKIAETAVVPNSLAYNTGAEVYYYGDHYGTNLYGYDVSSASNVLIADLTNHGMPANYALSGGADFYNGTYYYSPEIPEITPSAIPQQATDIYAVNFSADGLSVESHSQLNVELPDGWVSFGDFGDIAVDSSTGILYGSSTSVNGNFGDGAYFWSVDLNETDKKVNVISQNTSPNARAYQIAYNAIENALYANQFESGEFVVISKDDGSITSTAPISGDFYDLASTVVSTNVPEPSSALLLGMAASAGLLRRKRN
jgi:hypothetical protein